MIKLGRKINGFIVNYREIFNCFPSSIILLNDIGEIMDINSSMKKLFGYNKSELIGKNIRSIPKFSPDSLKLLKRNLNILMKDEIVKQFDLKAYKKDGNAIWVNVEALLIEINDSDVILLVIKDISQYKMMEVKLKEMDESRNDFVNLASHELKTPLSSVYGAIQLLNEVCREELSEKAIEYVEIALNAGKKLKNLIFNLLDSARIDSGSFSLHRQRENLVNIIKGCVKDMTYLTREKNLKITMELPDEIHLKLDKGKIEQVITNLLSNAIKYTPNNGKIRIIVKKSKNFVETSIIDNGVGITKRDMGKLFKKFSRSDRSIGDSKSFESTGLGLFISKEIIEQHGGKIWAESKGSNKGSKFSFKLPVN